MTKLEALRQAQLAMMEDRMGLLPALAARGLDRVSAPRTGAWARRLPPYYWAAFTLSGDWR